MLTALVISFDREIFGKGLYNLSTIVFALLVNVSSSPAMRLSGAGQRWLFNILAIEGHVMPKIFQ